MFYDPKNWYWMAKDGRIYCSIKQALVKETDKAFVEWKKGGNLPTPWPKDLEGVETDEALAEVLAAHGLPLFVPILNEIKADLKTQIDQTAESERLKYITPGDGQAMTYQEKVNQAAEYSKAYAAYKAEPKERSEPPADEYLLLKASLGIDGDTLLEVAITVTQAYAMWQQVGAAIETIRLQTKAAIDAADTAEAAQAIFDAIEWPKP